jgi:hypothetical protein
LHGFAEGGKKDGEGKKCCKDGWKCDSKEEKSRLVIQDSYIAVQQIGHGEEKRPKMMRHVHGSYLVL